MPKQIGSLAPYLFTLMLVWFAAVELTQRRAVVEGGYGVRTYPTLDLAAAFDHHVNVIPHASVIHTAVLAQYISGSPYRQIADQNTAYAGLRSYPHTFGAVVEHTAQDGRRIRHSWSQGVGRC